MKSWISINIHSLTDNEINLEVINLVHFIICKICLQRVMRPVYVLNNNFFSVVIFFLALVISLRLCLVLYFYLWSCFWWLFVDVWYLWVFTVSYGIINFPHNYVIFFDLFGGFIEHCCKSSYWQSIMFNSGFQIYLSLCQILVEHSCDLRPVLQCTTSWQLSKGCLQRWRWKSSILWQSDLETRRYIFLIAIVLLVFHSHHLRRPVSNFCQKRRQKFLPISLLSKGLSKMDSSSKKRALLRSLWSKLR